MKVDKVTSIEVARRAGVSQSAVSRVFTPGASVSAKTAEKVHKAAAELGYRPNVLARAMITGRSRIIGLVVAYLDNQFYPEALEKLSNALQKQGYHVLVFMASNDDAATATVIEELLDYQVDGIIAASVSLSNDLTERCQSAGIPIVLFNRLHDSQEFCGVASDNFEGGRKLAEFLVAGHHKKIAHISGWEGASTQRDREKGFLHGLAQGGSALFAKGVGNYHAEQAQMAAREMFTGADIPDAVFVANDHMAFAVMDVLRFELGLRIPEDVSVVAYDDVNIASWPSYNLTTIRQRANLMVDETVKILIERIENNDLPAKTISLEAPLIVRGSARIPKGWTL